MQSRSLLIIVFHLLTLYAPAQEGLSTGAPPVLPGGLLHQDCVNIFDAMVQPALLTKVARGETGLLAERKMNLPELSDYWLAIRFGSENTALACFGHYSGKAGMFQQSGAGIAYAKTLGPASLGIAGWLHLLRIGSNAPELAVSAEISTAVKLTERVSTAVRVRQISIAGSGGRHNKLIPSFELVLGCHMSEGLAMGVSLSKTPRLPPQASFTMLYKTEPFRLKLRWDSGSQQPAISVGYIIHHIQVEGGAAIHASLGVTPLLILIYKREGVQK